MTSRLRNDELRYAKATAVSTILLAVASCAATGFAAYDLISKDRKDIITQEQLRAAFGFPTLWFIGVKDTSGKMTGQAVVVTFTNIGASRTDASSGWASIAYYEGDIPNNFDPSAPANNINTTNTIPVGSGGSISIPPIMKPLSNFSDASDGKGKLIVWGRFDYNTVFDPKTQHHVSFCAILNVSKPAQDDKNFQQQQTLPFLVQPTPYSGHGCNSAS